MAWAMGAIVAPSLVVVAEGAVVAVREQKPAVVRRFVAVDLDTFVRFAAACSHSSPP